MFAHIFKHNVHHDARGRFSTADNASFSSIKDHKAVAAMRLAHHSKVVREKAHALAVHLARSGNMKNHTPAQREETKRLLRDQISAGKTAVKFMDKEQFSKALGEGIDAGSALGKKLRLADKAKARKEKAKQAALEAAKPNTPEKVLSEFDDLGVDLGSSGTYGRMEAAKNWHANMNGVTPKEYMKAMFGDAKTDFHNVKINAYTSKVEHKADHIQVHGAEATAFNRSFDFNTGDVHHDYLKLKEGDQGKGAVKDPFKACLPLYDKMGLHTASVFAALDKGAYTWAKYGFRFAKPSEASSYMSSVMGRLNGVSSFSDKVPKDPNHPARKEVSAIFKIAESGLAGNLHSNQMLSDIQTPALDKLYRGKLDEIYPNGTGTYSKWLMKETCYDGVLDLKDKHARQRADSYVNGKKK